MPVRVSVKITLITLCCFLFSCTPKAKVKEVYKPGFTNFEISFAGYDHIGIMGQYSFAVDSNKSFFVMSDGGQRINYGVLPDSIFKSIDSALVKLIQEQPKLICDSSLIVCGGRVYAVVLRYKNDTLKLRYIPNCTGHLIYPIDSIIQKYAGNLPWQPGAGEVFDWETVRMINPPPSQKFLEMLSKEK